MQKESTGNRKLNVTNSSLICLIGNLNRHFISMRPPLTHSLGHFFLFPSSQHLPEYSTLNCYYAEKYGTSFTSLCSPDTYRGLSPSPSNNTVRVFSSKSNCPSFTEIHVSLLLKHMHFPFC